jgi:hypothetical protein
MGGPMTELMAGAWHDGLVTVPTPSSPTPPGGSTRYDPWRDTAQHSGHGHGAGRAPEGELRRELRDGVLCALAVTLLGVVLGLLWEWLAPHVPLFTDGKAVYLKDPEGEEAVGADGTFVLLALACGAVTGAAVFLRDRSGGIGRVVGLAVGALLGSVVAWRLGVWLGPASDVVETAKQAGKGTTFSGPLQLQAKAALLTWPIIAVLVNLGLVGLFGPRDPEPQYGEGDR